MKFVPCQDLCNITDDLCQGCGRTASEIAETKQVVKNAVDFAKKQGYENPEDFVAAISKSILKKISLPEKQL